jgi:hypothetical protein
MGRCARAQVKLLQRKFEAVLGEEGRHLVDVNTIDGFQARNTAVPLPCMASRPASTRVFLPCTARRAGSPC